MPSQNWLGRKGFENIKILDIKVIVKDVERILDISPPDHQEIEKAKKLLKEHEQSLVEAIAKLDNMSDSKNEEDDQFSIDEPRSKPWYGLTGHTDKNKDCISKACLKAREVLMAITWPEMVQHPTIIEMTTMGYNIMSDNLFTNKTTRMILACDFMHYRKSDE
ncbi:protein EMSY-LIKE 2-like [Zingiber officinale]|uniref:protein EMSY-LIKE 2-like n=1 Tax=Zingiber officinale TaxID=94328 RepID=UPI001C4BB842|nr:protein EMSY-LIKE 2-like [Zingiber officinale]